MTDSSGDERGFTLVELLVSMTIIVMTLLGSLYVTIGYFRTSHDTYSRTTAIQVASEQMETMKAVGWNDLGFYGSDNAPVCPASLPCNGQTPALSLGSTRPTGAAAPSPVRTVTRGNVTFTVTSYLTSVVTSATADAGRRIVVQVAWTVRGRSLTAQIDALRSPVFTELSGVGSSTTSPTPTPTPTASAPTAAVTVTSVATTSTVCLKADTSPPSAYAAFVLRVGTTNTTTTDDVTVTWASNADGVSNAADGSGTASGMTFDVAVPVNTAFSGASNSNMGNGQDPVNYPVTIKVTRASDGTSTVVSSSFSYVSKNSCP